MSPPSILECASRYEASNRREKPHMTLRCGCFFAASTTDCDCTVSACQLIRDTGGEEKQDK